MTEAAPPHHPERTGASLKTFPDGSCMWSVSLCQIGTGDLATRIEAKLPSLYCGPLLVHHMPQRSRTRFLAELEMYSMFEHRAGFLSRDAPRPLAVMSLTMGAAIGGESVSGLGLWVDPSHRQKRIGSGLLTHAAEFTEIAIQALCSYYKHEVGSEELRSLLVYVTSDPDPEMIPKMSSREWYGKLYRIFVPQGFTVNRQVWSHDPQDGGPLVPSLMRRFVVAPR